MLGNFMYCNPTKLYFGEDPLSCLNEELPKYGKNVQDDNTSDYLMEGLLRSLIHSGRIAVKNPTDYEARNNIMWIATWR